MVALPQPQAEVPNPNPISNANPMVAPSLNRKQRHCPFDSHEKRFFPRGMMEESASTYHHTSRVVATLMRLFTVPNLAAMTSSLTNAGCLGLCAASPSR